MSHFSYTRQIPKTSKNEKAGNPNQNFISLVILIQLEIKIFTKKQNKSILPQPK